MKLYDFPNLNEAFIRNLICEHEKKPCLTPTKPAVLNHDGEYIHELDKHSRLTVPPPFSQFEETIECYIEMFSRALHDHIQKALLRHLPKGKDGETPYDTTCCRCRNGVPDGPRTEGPCDDETGGASASGSDGNV